MFSRNALITNCLSCLLLIVIAGCQSQPTLIPDRTVTPIVCGSLIGNSPEFICTQLAPDQYRIEASPEQVIWRFSGGTITLLGIINIEDSADRLLLTVLEGSAAISIPNSTRVVYAGGTASIDRSGNTLQLSTGIFTDTATQQAELSGACIPSRWRQEYIVQRGDTLSSIAQTFQIRLGALLEANCIADPGRLPIGTRLFIPYASDAQP